MKVGRLLDKPSTSAISKFLKSFTWYYISCNVHVHAH